MEPYSVVEAFDEGEDIALSLGARLVVAMMNELSLQPAAIEPRAVDDRPSDRRRKSA
jgi:hypothetical protein